MYLVKAVKGVEAENAVRSLKERERLLTHVVAKALSGPDTVRAVSSNAADDLLRWQRVYVLFSAIFLMFVTQIWCVRWIGGLGLVLRAGG